MTCKPTLRWMRGLTAAVIFFLSGSALMGDEKMAIHDLSVPYVSSEDPDLDLFAAFVKTGDEPKPILLFLQGWHGNRYHLERDMGKNTFLLDRYFLVACDKRGRGSSGKQGWWGTPNPELKGKEGFDSEGTPDCSGWEINDVIDAVETAKRLYPEHVKPGPVYVIGNSGGGGNTMAVIGKFPDYFTAAWADCGMADYGRWAELTSWRGSIEKWVGHKLEENPEAFRSRGGLTTAANRLTPVTLSHGDADQSVPVELSQVYVDANEKLGKPVPFVVVEGGKHSAAWGRWGDVVAFFDPFQSPPQIPEKGTFVVAGYLKTRRFQVILPTIDSIAQCEYDLSNGLALTLTGGEPGDVKVRVPKDTGLASAECTAGGKPVQVTTGTWRDWQEFRLPYSGEARLDLR